MSRIQAFRKAIEGTQALTDNEPVDDQLLSMLVHAAFADGVVAEEEFDLFSRVMPGKELGEVFVYVASESEEDMDWDALLAAFPAPSDRKDLVALAEVMIGIDRQHEQAEQDFVEELKQRI